MPDFWNIFYQQRHYRTSQTRRKIPISIWMFPVYIDSIKGVRILMEGIVGPLVPDEQECQDTECESDSQAGNVDEGIGFVTNQISESDSEVVPEH